MTIVPSDPPEAAEPSARPPGGTPSPETPAAARLGIRRADGTPGTRSWLAGVNPVTRIAIAIVLSIPLLASVDVVSAAVVVALEIGCLGLTALSLGALLRRLAPVLVFAPVAGVSMLLYAKPDGRVYGTLWLATVSDASIALAVAVTLRVVALGLPTVMLFAGTDPTDVADALAQIVRLPARFVVGVLAGARTLSLFQDDWRALRLARRARGIGDHGIVRRTASMSFTLLVLAVRRGAALALAMEARGFGSGIRRTWARPSRLHPRDAGALAAAVMMIAVALACALVAGALHPIWA